MRRFRFYTERQKIRVGSSVKLPDFEASHIQKSLRLKKGDEIYLFNGEKEFRAKLKLVSKDAVMAEVIEIYANVSDKKIIVDLFQGLTKAKSFEEIIEKTTELGVNAIYPMQTEYSVIDIDKVESKLSRWNRIILSACKQSERVSIPEIHTPITSKDAPASLTDYDHVFILSPREGKNILTVLNELREEISETQIKIAVLVGPEGGFSKKETDSFNSISNIQSLQISKSILRSETASSLAIGLLRLLSL